MTQVAPTAPQILVSPVVQLVNEDPEGRTFNMKYGPTQRLVLQPGERLFVNEDVAWHFLGRWWADNSNPRDRARQNEYQRLRTLYGAYEDEPTWQASLAFALKAYDPTGKPIITVVDDPDGVHAGAGQTPMGREMSLEAQVEIMRQQMQVMLAQLEAQQGQQPPAPADVPPPMPTPSTPFNPAGTPPESPTVAGVAVPVTPAPVGLPVPGITSPAIAEEEPARFPVQAAVAYDPAEQAAPEDNPQTVKTSPVAAPGATGGRIGG